MTIEPHDWNIVLLGYWNQAILTPSGIAERLFLLEKGESTYVVEVPINGLAPFKVSHNGLSVSVAKDRLEIKLDAPDFESLERAFEIAIRALKRLPETPVSAVGFNLRYRVNNPDSEIAKVTQASVEALDDLELDILSCGMSRKIKYKQGVINLLSAIDMDSGHELQLNFHRDSDTSEKHDKLVEWLRLDLQKVKTVVQDILNTIERHQEA